MTHGATIAGLVQDSTGVPIPGARIVAIPAGRDDGGGATGAAPESRAPSATSVEDAGVAPSGASASLPATESDLTGRFHLVDLPRVPLVLLVEAPGLGSATTGSVTPPDPNVRVVVEGRVRAVAGHVLEGGRPAPGAIVWLGGESLPRPRMARAGEAGGFQFAGLGPGTYALRAVRGNAASLVAGDVVVDPAPEGVVRAVDLVLQAADSRPGVVVDDRGAPVAHATVNVDQIPATDLWAPAMADARGKFSLTGLVAGTYRLRARQSGFVPGPPVTFSVGAQFAARPRPNGESGSLDASAPSRPGAPSEPPALRVTLLRTTEIAGRVVDERGNGIAGAVVRDLVGATDELGATTSTLPPAAEAAMSSGDLASSSPASTDVRRAVSRANGDFVLAGVPPGNIRLEVLHPGFAAFVSAPMALSPGQRHDAGKLALVAAIRVSGAVVDQQGQPLPKVRVAGVPATGAGAGDASMTDGQGRFQLALAPGDYRLAAHAGEGAPVTEVVRVQAGAPVPDVTLRVVRGDRAVEGLVRDTEWRPIARARLSIRASASDPGAPVVATTVTDAGGHFQVSGLPAQPLSVEVDQPTYPLFRATLPPGGETATIEVPVPGRLEGDVHERVSGALIRQYELVARGPTGTEVRFSSREPSRNGKGGNPGGRFSLGRMVPGTWTLHVTAAGYRAGDRVVEVPAAATPGEVSRADVRVELDPG